VAEALRAVPKEDFSKKTFESSLMLLADARGRGEIFWPLRVALSAAKKRKEPIEHTLFYGGPGLGKTTLAYIIANEMDVSIKTSSGPAIEKPGDLAAILTSLQPNDILFIDEIHRLKTIIEEILYSAMEDFALDIIIGKGPSAKTMRLSLPKFTLIGATTKMSMLSSPLRDRFGSISHLKLYDIEEIQKIIHQSAEILKIRINKEASLMLAKCSRQTPRIANRLLRRVRDYASIKDSTNIDLSIVDETLKALGIDESGLDDTDKQLLKTIIDKFNGGPVGLSTIAAATGEEKETIEEVYEPFLIKMGFLERTQRGRRITQKAYQYLGLPHTIGLNF